jgi:hypothetical protein
MDEWKGDLWNTAGIPSPPGDAETNEAIVFGYLVAWFLGEASFASSLTISETDVSSSSLMRRAAPSLLTSTNGLPESLFH